MRSLSRFKMGATALALVVVSAVAADAQAGLGRRLVRGITYSLSPTIGTIQNGPNVNNNIFAQRFSENPITDGKSYEFERFFGDDSYGSADTLNLGFLNVQLRQPDGTGLQGSGVYSKVGYNKRLVPEFYWESRTTGRNFGSFAGAGSVSAPLQYLIETNNGFESSTLAGQLNYTSNGSMNLLGFYDVELSASNTGTWTTDGLAEDRNQNVDFDIGPINLSGNAFIDAALSVADLIGEQVFGIPPDDFNPNLARLRSADEIAAAVAAGESITAPELASLVEAHLADPEGVPLPENPNAAAAAAGAANPVPEPGSLLLLAIAAAALARRRAR